MSMSAGPRSASGVRTPGQSRTGRRLTYWRNCRRMGISSPHRDTWSATPGYPTAPRNTASKSASSAMLRPPVHAAGACIQLARPVELRPVAAETGPLPDRREQLLGGRHDLLADPVPGNDRNAIASFWHGSSSARQTITSAIRLTVVGRRRHGASPRTVIDPRLPTVPGRSPFLWLRALGTRQGGFRQRPKRAPARSAAIDPPRRVRRNPVVRDGHVTAPVRRSAAISSAPNPASPSTSSVCWPSRGAGTARATAGSRRA